MWTQTRPTSDLTARLKGAGRLISDSARPLPAPGCLKKKTRSVSPVEPLARLVAGLLPQRAVDSKY